MVDMRRRRQFDRCNRYICKWFFDLRLFFLTFCYCLLSNWAPVLNCGSHTWTKGSMFDRKIRVENIDARTISDPLPCSANMGGWVKTRSCLKSNQYPTRGLFSILPFPMHGWRESTHRSEVRRPDNQSWIGLDTVDTGKSNKQRWIGAGVLSEWKQTNCHWKRVRI